MTLPPSPHIELRGVRVHNLQNVDLDLPLGKLIVVTGVSGSGKSSLAFDTLYAEGQRRYVESFSTSVRRFLERFEKPDADRIEPIPPAIAVRQRAGGHSRRATVGTVTEICDSLRLLFARIGVVECPDCSRRVERHSPDSARCALDRIALGRRMVVAFAGSGSAFDSTTPDPVAIGSNLARLAEAGFTRLICDGEILNVADAETRITDEDFATALVVVDRVTSGASRERLTDTLELAFRHGTGSAAVLVEKAEGEEAAVRAGSAARNMRVDGRDYDVLEFSERLICTGCGREFADAEPALFNFNSPLGACPNCRGLGDVASAENTRGARHTCPTCLGARLRPEALAVRLSGRTIVGVAAMSSTDLAAFVDQVERGLEPDVRNAAGQVLQRLARRIAYLQQVGLGYLTLDRPLRTLSVGEAQRVRLTAALGSNLVDMLYVLDEPTAGLHPHDIERLLAALLKLRNAGNTVVVVEHDTAVIRAADDVVDVGPGAGRDGGRVVFHGPPGQLDSAESVTAGFFSGRRNTAERNGRDVRTPTGWLRLEGVEHHNLHGVSVEFPLGVLCVVTGVSGSGKSSLVEETLYPAVVSGLQQRTRLPDDKAGLAATDLPQSRLLKMSIGRYDSLVGLEHIDNAMLIDQAPISRSGRGTPAGYLNLFAEIRSLFAATAEAKVRNFTAGHFSFVAPGGGRCETCRGAGTISVDMQFLPDVVLTCPDCRGTRFRSEVLEARYRGLSIAEVLSLTVGEAFSFFRGRHRLQRRLKVLRDVGLDYITLGQPADTLSGGESQRLKLASFLAMAGRSRTLFVIDEPTTGLHPADVVRLIETLGQLAAAGHSLVVVEHNLDFVRLADYVIDLGPGAAEAGGRVVATGVPAAVAQVTESVTGRFLAGTAGP
ncbi:MAG: excinuclease ABC subunit UvrA [Planctomycetia bacterium]|nr:excinuclease ABC subunit UvrA [Planctomycetia bacterium]